MELWTAFILGLVGSLHCAGMCGPLALALPATGSSAASFFLGRIAYNGGRILTYTLLGALFGLLGKTFVMAGFQRWLSLVAGIAILLALAASTRFTLNTRAANFVDWIKSGFATLLRQRTFRSLFLLGTLNGFLPCGLVYVACAAAIAAGGVLESVSYMALFGMGTFPMMLAISVLGKKLQFRARLKFQKLIPICAGLLGVLLVLRGLSLGIPYLSPDISSPTACSSCH